jgi:hypothetical protein
MCCSAGEFSFLQGLIEVKKSTVMLKNEDNFFLGRALTLNGEGIGYLGCFTNFSFFMLGNFQCPHPLAGPRHPDRLRREPDGSGALQPGQGLHRGQTILPVSKDHAMKSVKRS